MLVKYVNLQSIRREYQLNLHSGSLFYNFKYIMNPVLSLHLRYFFLKFFVDYLKDSP